MSALSFRIRFTTRTFYLAKASDHTDDHQDEGSDVNDLRVSQLTSVYNRLKQFLFMGP